MALERLKRLSTEMRKYAHKMEDVEPEHALALHDFTDSLDTAIAAAIEAELEREPVAWGAMDPDGEVVETCASYREDDVDFFRKYWEDQARIRDLPSRHGSRMHGESQHGRRRSRTRHGGYGKQTDHPMPWPTRAIGTGICMSGLGR